MKDVLRKHPKLGNSENGYSVLGLLPFSRLEGAFITMKETSLQQGKCIPFSTCKPDSLLENTRAPLLPAILGFLEIMAWKEYGYTVTSHLPLQSGCSHALPPRSRVVGCSTDPGQINPIP